MNDLWDMSSGLLLSNVVQTMKPHWSRMTVIHLEILSVLAIQAFERHEAQLKLLIDGSLLCYGILSM